MEGKKAKKEKRWKLKQGMGGMNIVRQTERLDNPEQFALVVEESGLFNLLGQSPL